MPDPLPGVEFDRMKIAPGGRKKGIPHRPGTKEYLFCEKGHITLWAHGERFEAGPGDLVAFQGDQPHSYINERHIETVAFSVVMLAPVF